MLRILSLLGVGMLLVTSLSVSAQDLPPEGDSLLAIVQGILRELPDFPARDQLVRMLENCGPVAGQPCPELVVELVDSILCIEGNIPAFLADPPAGCLKVSQGIIDTCFKGGSIMPPAPDVDVSRRRVTFGIAFVRAGAPPEPGVQMFGINSNGYAACR